MDDRTKKFLKELKVDIEKAEKWLQDNPNGLNNEKDIAIYAIKENPKNIRRVNGNLTRTISFMRRVIKECPFEAIEYYYKDKYFFEDEKFMEDLATKYPRFVEEKLLQDSKIYDSHFKDENLMNILLQGDYSPELLKYIKVESKKNSALMQKLVNIYGLNNEEDVMIQIHSIKENPKNIRHIDGHLLRTISFMTRVIEECPFETIEYYYKDEYFFEDEKFMENLATKYPRFVEEKLLQDPKIYDSHFKDENLMNILLQGDYSPELLKYIKVERINNSALMLKLVNIYGLKEVIFKIGNKLRNDLGFLVDLIDKYGLEDITPILGEGVKYNLNFINILLEKYSQDDIFKIMSETEFEKAFLKYHINRGLNSEIDEVIQRWSNHLKYIKNPETLHSAADDGVVMLALVTIYPPMYSYASNRLKTDGWFTKEAIKRGIPRDIVEEEYEKAQKEKKENRQKGAEEYQKTRERNKEREVELLKKEYMIENGEHPNVSLVKKFIESKSSKGKFCRDNDLSEAEFESILEEVSTVFPDLKKGIEQHSKQTGAIYLQQINQKISGILNGQINIYEYAREKNESIKVEDLLMHCTEKGRKELEKKILKAIISGRLNMKDYARLFSDNYDYKSIIENVNSFISQVTRDNPELNRADNSITLAKKQIHALEKYEKQYRATAFLGSKYSYENEQTGETVGQEVTEEVLDYVIKYLKLRDEYICCYTVNNAIFKLIKGEITRDQIDKKEIAREPVDIPSNSESKKEETVKENNQHLSKKEAMALFLQYLVELKSIEDELVQAKQEYDIAKVEKLEKRKNSKITQKEGLRKYIEDRSGNVGR